MNIQSSHENPSGNCVFLFKKTKKFVGTDLFAFFQFVGYGSQNQLFDALEWGTWQAGKACAKCRQYTKHVSNSKDF